MTETPMQSAQDDAVQMTLVERIKNHRNALTLKEFAELFSISYRTAFEMATRAQIPAIQIGSCWRIDSVELAAWVEQQKVTASARRMRASPGNSAKKLRSLQARAIKLGITSLRPER